MKTIFVFCVVLLVACTKKPTHEQLTTVINACAATGMEYQIRGDVIQCFIPEK